MSGITLICRSGTPFTADGKLDEQGLRGYLHRFIDARLGVNLASGGSGEGHALSIAELKRVYEIGVEECKGKVPVFANPPEQHTVRATREQTMLAVEAGVDVVNVYPPAAWHGMRPKDSELVAYYDDLFGEIKYPIALSVNPVIGYLPDAATIADVCQRYKQIAILNLFGVSDGYLVDVKDRIARDLPIHVPLRGSLNALALGARGLVGAEANVLPKTHRQYIDLYEQKRTDEIGAVYAHILRFKQFAARWEPANPRWIKMAMKVLKLPGGAGGVREPYRNPTPEDLRAFTDGLLKLGVPEIDEQARAAGLAVRR
ncbi:MAG: dihydrodipicolinate synthase family protein [Betaproteobacteria bacterium]|nr:dihydrodipicolinate synthase family protein [Betaproteobacteria bacterium]